MIDDGYIKDGLVFAMGGGLLVDTAKNNTITNNGATLTTDHNGRANRGWALDGVDDSIVLPNTLIRNKSAFSIVVGFNRYAGSPNANLFSFYSDTTNRVEFTYVSNILYSLFNVNEGRVTDTVLGQKFAALIYDGSGTTNADKIKIYLGATAQSITFSGTMPASVANVDATFRIGIHSVTFRKQDIDLFLMYDRPLQSNEALYNYNYWLSH